MRGSPSFPPVGRNSRLWLDAGADDSADGGTLTVSGPNLPGVPLDGDDDYYYRLFSARLEDGGASVAGNPSHRLAPGTHTLRGAGGSNVGPFEASLQMPELLKWTDRDTIQEVRRDTGFELSWSVHGPRGNPPVYPRYHELQDTIDRRADGGRFQRRIKLLPQSLFARRRRDRPGDVRVPVYYYGNPSMPLRRLRDEDSC